MTDHVQRVVKRRYGTDRRDWFALGKNFALFAIMGQITRKNLAIVIQRLLRGELIHVLRAFGFIDCMLVADAKFQHQPFGQIFTTFADQFPRTTQNLAAFVTTERRLVVGGYFKGAGGVFGLTRRDRSDYFFGVGVTHFDYVASKDDFAADAHAFMPDIDLFGHGLVVLHIKVRLRWLHKTAHQNCVVPAGRANQ